MPAYLMLPITWTALALLLAGCGQREQRGTADAAPVVVQLIRPDTSARGLLTLPARVKAAEEATLTARSSGRVSSFPVREGMPVAEGALLARFDAPEARRTVEAARAEEQAARIAATVAARQHARVESLYTVGVLSLSDRETAESSDRTAAARLALAAAARETAESAFEVRAPFAGVLVRRHVDVGADVQPGTPLVDLRSPGGSEVVTAVPEAAARDLRSVKAWVQAGDGAWHPARLLRADGMVDPATRSRTARYAPVGMARIEPGAFARVRLEVGSGDGGDVAGRPLSVPASSIVRRGALTGVFVVESGQAWLRWVRLGAPQAGRVPVLSGLEASDVVVAVPGGLEDGARVKAGS